MEISGGTNFAMDKSKSEDIRKKWTSRTPTCIPEGGT